MKLKSLSQKDRYGNMFSVEFFEPDASIPMMMVIPDMADGYNGADSSNHPGEPKGTDTVPAWLTPGENVVNAEASRLPGNQEKIDEMNEQGREIQAAQGGPIPTYAADGKKITKRKMPNGKMGLWKGNTYLGIDESSSFLGDISEAAKEGWEQWNPFNSDGGSVPALYSAGGSQVPRYDGMLNSLGNKLSARDGGPMYSAAGDPVLPLGLRQNNPGNIRSGSDDWLGLAEGGNEGYATFKTPEYGLRSMARTLGTYADKHEIGTVNDLVDRYAPAGDNTEESRANYKTVAANALGVGVNDPIDLKAARSKLMPAMIGFENANQMPYTQQQIDLAIQAAGTDDPDEVRAILSANAEVPPQDGLPPELVEKGVTASDLIQADQKPGMMSAMAQTNATPPSPQSTLTGPPPTQIQEIPVYKDDNLSDVIGKNLLGPEAQDKGPAAESRKRESTWLSNNPFPEDIIVDNKGRPQSVNPNQIDPAYPAKIAKRLADGKLSQEQYDNLLSGYNQRVKQDKAHKRWLEAKDNIQEEVPIAISNQETNKKIKVLDEQIKDAEESGDDTLVAALEAKKIEVEKEKVVPEVDKKPPEVVTTTLKAIMDAANESNSPTPTSGDEPDIKEKGKQIITEDPSLATQFIEGVKDAFGDLFDPGELARMAVVYLGSRALGYDHAGSFSYSAKSYVDRLESAEEGKRVAAKDRLTFSRRKDIMENYTAASIEEFLKTGNVKSLIEKDGTNVKSIGQGKPIYHDTYGVLQTVKVGEGKYMIVRPDGSRASFDAEDMVGRTNEYDPNEVDPLTVRNNLKDKADKRIINLNKQLKLKDNEVGIDVLIDTELLSQDAAKVFGDEIAKFGGNRKARNTIRQQIELAQNDYLEAVKAHKEGKGDMPNSIETFYNRRIMPLKTRGAISYKDVENVNPESFALINKKILEMSGKNPRSYNALWTSFKQAWDTKGKKHPAFKDMMSETEETGHNSFTYFVNVIIDDDLNPEKHKLAMSMLAPPKSKKE